MTTGRRPKLLNVRKHLEHEIYLVDKMLEYDGKHKDGLRLAPIWKDALIELRFMAKAILRSHAAKQTRKDLYVERPTAD